MAGSHAESPPAQRLEAPETVASCMGKVLVVSPHLDDAVLGCADLLARHPGACVLTVFAGSPQDGPLTDWDRLSGLKHADEVMPIRKEEDLLALFLLDAYPVWLDYLDAQYASRPAVEEVAASLRAAITREAPDHVLFPLGLFHTDHRLASDATLMICRTLPDPRWIVYSDALYRQLPGLVQQRLQELRSNGCSLAPLVPPPRHPAKRRAVECYESQLRALATPGHIAIEQAFAREQYWSIACAP